MELAPSREMESPTRVAESREAAVSYIFAAEDGADIAEPMNCAIIRSYINVPLIERTLAEVYAIIIFELHLSVTRLRACKTWLFVCKPSQSKCKTRIDENIA